ncbi:MAG: 5'/3'-nucleotidase SurE [Armatimonadota bacterium]|nr:5'/3'-nucleotidase SurE [Armatimonadota bacterium]
MRILVTNDDGVQADGLFALSQALSEVGDVTVVAPERQQSATGHAITLHKPLRMTPTTLRDGSAAWMSNGTPSDCTTLGILEAMGGDVDLVVSGINHGPNLGWDLHYSGTVSAAIEAAIIGKPSLAVSVASWDKDIHWTPVAQFAAQIAQWLVKHPLPPHTILNVNAPNLPQSDIKGVAVTTQGRRQYVDRIEKRLDPVGRPYYWLGGSLAEEAEGAETGSDVRAVADGLISITPIHLDLTAYALMPSLKEWDSSSQ